MERNAHISFYAMWWNWNSSLLRLYSCSLLRDWASNGVQQHAAALSLNWIRFHYYTKTAITAETIRISDALNGVIGLISNLVENGILYYRQFPDMSCNHINVLMHPRMLQKWYDIHKQTKLTLICSKDSYLKRIVEVIKFPLWATCTLSYVPAMLSSDTPPSNNAAYDNHYIVS